MLFRILTWSALLPVMLIGNDPAYAVKVKGVDHPPIFTKDPSLFKPSITLPVTDKQETVSMPTKNITLRLEHSQKDPRVEPLQLRIPKDVDRVRSIAAKIARYRRVDDLTQHLLDLTLVGEPVPGTNIAIVTLNTLSFSLINPSKFGDLFAKVHHNLKVDTRMMKESPSLRSEFMKQIRPFFNQAERTRLAEKALNGYPINMDKELLPRFARKMVKKFPIFRGPNCFHAALAFQDPMLTKSSLVNVKEEKGYHRAMINYDELWRVLNTNFYEVDPKKSPLKYGDIMVFFEVPKEGGPVRYKWIRHTAAYLFGPYTFSKGSKSPNSPYTVKTVAEEWRTWTHHTKNLGVKIFRRSAKNVSKKPPKDLADWLY